MDGRKVFGQRIVVAISLLLFSATYGLVFSPPVSAGTQYVTDCGDSGPNTLRGEIATAGPGDTILFDQDCTILLTGGTLTLAQEVTIEGLGHTVIVDGKNSGMVFKVNSGVTATLGHLTIQHGSGFASGGGIGNDGTLMVANCNITGNSTWFNNPPSQGGGGGIYNSGTLTVVNSTISDNNTSAYHGEAEGGGIYNASGTLTVTNSAISGNTACASGGGIANGGTATVTNSTITGNAARAGSDCGLGEGGGIANSGTLTLANSTVANNNTLFFACFGSMCGNPGGGIYAGGTVTVTNSTVSGNNAGNSIGGGIASSGSMTVVTLINTLVANSTGGDVSMQYGGSFSGNDNLIDDAASAGGFTDGTSGNIIGHPALLGTLGDNGGPTQTIPLLPGSPSIAHGDPAVCNAAPVNGVDQRGVTRPTSLCAIGAFEPLLSAITPATGVTNGGTTVTLTGAGFAAGATVTIGGVACTNVHIVNSTTLTCTTGAHPTGTVDVVVTVGMTTGTLTGGYTYTVPDAIPSGKPQGGTPGGSPSPLPGGRSQGGAPGSPNPLPPSRP